MRYTLFHPIWMSWYSKSIYQDVAWRWKGVGFAYLFLLVILCCSAFTLDWHKKFNTFFYYTFEAPEEVVANQAPHFLGYRKVIAQIPTITIKNGQASIETKEPLILSLPGSQVPLAVIDTSGKTGSEALPAGVTSEHSPLLVLTKTELVFLLANMQSTLLDLQQQPDLVITAADIPGLLRKLYSRFIKVLFPSIILSTLIFSGALAFLVSLALFAGAKFLKLEDVPFSVTCRLAAIAITPLLLWNTLKMLEPRVLTLPAVGFVGIFLLALGMGFSLHTLRQRKLQ